MTSFLRIAFLLCVLALGTGCTSTAREQGSYIFTGLIGDQPIHLTGKSQVKTVTDAGPDLSDVGSTVSTATGILGGLLPGPWGLAISSLGSLLAGSLMGRKGEQSKRVQDQADFDAALEHIPTEHADKVKSKLSSSKKARKEAQARVKA